MGKPSDTVVSSIKWLNFLFSFISLGVGIFVSLVMIISPTMITTVGMPCGLALCVALLFKVIEQLLILIYLPDTWAIFTTTFFMSLIFIVLAFVAFKSYFTMDTFSKVGMCLMEDTAATTLSEATTSLADIADGVDGVAASASAVKVV